MNAQETRREPKGAVEHTGINAKFLQVSYGCLCEVSKQPVDGWTNPTHQLSGEVIRDRWIKIYKALEIWVNKIEWYDRVHGDQEYRGWKLHGDAGGINYVLDLPLNGLVTQKFMLSAKNMDFNTPLEFAAWTDNQEGKLAVWLKQNDQTIYQYYKKGDMKECPEPIEREGIGGKKTWDWTETDKFLWNEMQNVIAPTIELAAAARGYRKAENAQATYSGMPSDDFPAPGAAGEAPEGFPANPTARSLSDLVTARQLGMIRAIAREMAIDADQECNTVMRCKTDELSKRAASALIQHLQEMQKGPASAQTPAHTMPPTQPVTPPAPSPAQESSAAPHPYDCTCPNCEIPF